MSYITTCTGKHFDPVNPNIELIDIRDIAHSLSLLCRGNGHVKFFYSVGQHSIACAREAAARGLSRRIQLGCLLHDASEAYLSDVTRPVKQYLSTYLEIEKKLQNIIFDKFFPKPLTPEELQQIFIIDDDMLSYEFLHLMPESLDTRYKKIKANLSCCFTNPASIEQEFLTLSQNLLD